MTDKRVHAERLLTSFVLAFIDQNAKVLKYLGYSLYDMGIEVISSKPLAVSIQGGIFTGNKLVPESKATQSQSRAISLLAFLAHVVGCAVDASYDKHYDRVISEVCSTFSRKHRYSTLSSSARSSLEYPYSKSGVEILVEDVILLAYFREKMRDEKFAASRLSRTEGLVSLGQVCRDMIDNKIMNDVILDRESCRYRELLRVLERYDPGFVGPDYDRLAAYIMLMMSMIERTPSDTGRYYIPRLSTDILYGTAVKLPIRLIVIEPATSVEMLSGSEPVRIDSLHLTNGSLDFDVTRLSTDNVLSHGDLLALRQMYASLFSDSMVFVNIACIEPGENLDAVFDGLDVRLLTWEEMRSLPMLVFPVLMRAESYAKARVEIPETHLCKSMLAKHAALTTRKTVTNTNSGTGKNN